MIRGFETDGRRHRFPVLVGEILADGFPFASWAAANRFEYPADARTFLSQCGSAAEAFFAREFCRRDGVTYMDDGAAMAAGIVVTLQARAGRYRIDALVGNASTTIAVEIDGLAFHRQDAAQVAADYLRQRRIVALGFPVVRFTADEVFRSPVECWRQIESILSQRKIS